MSSDSVRCEMCGKEKFVQRGHYIFRDWDNNEINYPKWFCSIECYSNYLLNRGEEMDEIDRILLMDEDEEEEVEDE